MFKTAAAVLISLSLLFTPVQDDCHDTTGLDGLLDASGQLVGEPVRFRIRDPCLTGNDSHLFRGFFYVFAEQVDQVRVQVEIRHAGQETGRFLELPVTCVSQVRQGFCRFHRGKHGRETLREIAQDLLAVFVRPVPETEELASVFAAEKFCREAGMMSLPNLSVSVSGTKRPW